MRVYTGPGSDHDDVLEKARITFAEAVRATAPPRELRNFASLCIDRQ